MKQLGEIQLNGTRDRELDYGPEGYLKTASINSSVSCYSLDFCLLWGDVKRNLCGSEVESDRVTIPLILPFLLR